MTQLVVVTFCGVLYCIFKDSYVLYVVVMLIHCSLIHTHLLLISSLGILLFVKLVHCLVLFVFNAL